MLTRRLEPEVMDTPEEARDYDAMDHAEVNRVFAAEFLELLAAAVSADAGDAPARILDVGTGTARIPIELLRQLDALAAAGGAVSPALMGLRISAIDLAREMLALAERNVRAAGMAGQIALERIDAKRLPYPDGAFDAVMSNSIIHHLPDPVQALREMRRVLRPGGVLFVRDLLRPPDEPTLETLVAAYAGNESEHARRMFRDSLHAALTLEEVCDSLAAAGFPAEWARQTSDRHWTAAGRL